MKTLSEKIDYLFEHHAGEYMRTRQSVFNELSEQQTMFCCCGKLASGLHENNCKKFS